MCHNLIEIKALEIVQNAVCQNQNTLKYVGIWINCLALLKNEKWICYHAIVCNTPLLHVKAAAYYYEFRLQLVMYNYNSH